MALDKQFLLRHAYMYARHQGVGDEPASWYADWYVEEYGEEDEPLSHPTAYREWEEREWAKADSGSADLPAVIYVGILMLLVASVAYFVGHVFVACSVGAA